MKIRSKLAAMVAAGVTIATFSPIHAATITQIGYGDFTASNVLTDTFEGGLGISPVYSFDATAALIVSNANQLARSPITFLGDASKPLTVTFGGGAEVFEVGAWMGNDRFLQFAQVDFFLDAYDTGNSLLGTIFVSGNGDDLINQFVGLRSDMALGSVVFRNTSGIGNPGIVIDDFRIGYEIASPVVETPTLAILVGGLLSVVAATSRRSRVEVAYNSDGRPESWNSV